MTTEGGDQVAVPTDQPLLSKESETVELEGEVEEEQEVTEKKTSPVKTENDTTSIIPNDPPKEIKPNATSSQSPITVDDQNNKTEANEQMMAKSQSEIHVSVTNSLSVSQTSKNSLMTFSSSGTFYDHATSKKKKVDLRITPKRVSHGNGKDTTDFRQMEQGLLQLLEDFHSGKLEAFSQDCTFDKMENVREQQEKLARLHFDLNTQQELCGQHTDEGIKMSKKNLSKLTENLQELSCSIEQLQSASPVSQVDS